MTDPFAGTRGPRDAKYMIVGESWGASEKLKSVPFVGQSGEELCERILPESGIDPAECFFTNVINEQPPANKMEAFFWPTKEAKANGVPLVRGLYPRSNVVESLKHLEYQIEAVKPNLIIGFGNYTLWALTESSFSTTTELGKRIPRGIGNWRGSQLSTRLGGRAFLPTYHPAAIFRTWPWRYLIVHDLKMRAPKAFKLEWQPPKYGFLLRPSFEAVMNTLKYLETRAASKEGLDLSADLERRGPFIACLGLAWSSLDAICIPFMTTGNKQGYWSEEEEFAIVARLRQLLLSPGVRLIGQNFLYDAQYIALYWCLIPHIHFDTMVMHQVCWPGGGDPMKRTSAAGGVTRRDLGHLSSLYCDYHRYWKLEGKEWEEWMPEEQLWSYCCTDCVTAWEIAREEKALIARLNLIEQAECLMEQINTLMLPMMIRGVLVDSRRKADVTFELADTITLYEAWFEGIMPEDVYERKKKASNWYDSSKQQIEIFYELLGIRAVKHPKRGSVTVDSEALAVIATREPLLAPLTQKLEEYRSLCTFHNNFALALLDPDGRMRCSYDFVSTFRWGSRENVFGRGTNLQNIPKGSEE